MKNRTKIKTKDTNGITLIALVITIIVLLILAGIAISMLTGDNSILKRAGEAKELTDRAQVEEIIKLAYISATGDEITKGSDFDTTFKKELEKTYGEGNVTLTKSGDKYTIVIDKVGTFTVDSEGNVGDAVDPKYIPTISYIVGTSANATEDINGKAKANEGDDLFVIVTVQVEGEISEVTPSSGLTKVSEENGKYVFSTKAEGDYTVKVVTNKGTKNKDEKTENISISGAYKIANMPDEWVPADKTNKDNDWYAYTDNNGNIASVNGPKLAQGMTAIKYETSTGDLVNGSKWANAMTKDGSMWVWIPRYAYKITSGYHMNTDEIKAKYGDTREAGTIEIAFLKPDNTPYDTSISKVDIKTDISEVTYTGDVQNDWVLAPGFEFGGQSLDGFWFAKFEASNTDNTTGDDPSLTLKIAPNVTSWSDITAKNIFTVCLGIANSITYFDVSGNTNNNITVDTHMTKNVEWGAVTYLAHSKYGLSGREVYINNYNNHLTGMSGDTASAPRTYNLINKYNTTKGVNASTSKNVYGIYDMSGGVSEYISAVFRDDTKTYSDKLTDETKTEFIYKYIDIYDSYSSTKYGDALFETSNGNGGWYSWFEDYMSYIVWYNPVFNRGGDFYNKTSSGMFNLSSSSGDASYGLCGFRPVCVVE